MSAQTSPQAIAHAMPDSPPPAASTVPPAELQATPNTFSPGADFDLDEALRNALPDHGVVDWDDVAEKFLAAIPDKGWRKAMHSVAKRWCRYRVNKSHSESGHGGGNSLWRGEDAQAASDGNGNGKPWFEQASVRDSIERKLDEMWAGEKGTKRLGEFTVKDVASAKLRAESTVRTGLLRVKAFEALLKAMNEHKPKTVGDLPRDVLERVVPSLFVSAPMREDEA